MMMMMMTMMMMRIPKICSFHCILLLAISDDLTHFVEKIRIGGNPMTVHEISQLENSSMLHSPLQYKLFCFYRVYASNYTAK